MLAWACLHGFASQQKQLSTSSDVASRAKRSKALHDGVDVLIATPMRLVSALQRGLVDLSHVEWLVVDEADRLFENGFETQVGGC